MSVNLKSHTVAELRQAVADDYRLYALDTGSDGEDDVLFGMDYDEAHSDVVFYHDLDEWPSGWILREVTIAEVEA